MFMDFLTMENKIISFAIPTKLLDRVDKERKDMPRSRFMVRLLEQALGITKGEAKKYA